MSVKSWLLADLEVPSAKDAQEQPETQSPWWQVMCLTGVDYFSTLGYQPGIAFLAAGFLSPVATLVLVIVTLFAALPVYRRVCQRSPYGQGSVAMLQKLFPEWGGKLFVLMLLGFATTDFVITMTLSAADGAAHLIGNPMVPRWVDHQVIVTLLILAALSAIFLKGFKEAIGIATFLVVCYLALNAVVVSVCFLHIFHQPELLLHWKNGLICLHENPWKMLAVSVLLFPRLALGLSGFETGVAVMPLIRADNTEQRIRNARYLLLSAALIMSLFLMATSIASTVLIPTRDFGPGGAANGRAMAFLAHQYLGNAFGTAYDISTILILGFAGASAMAGLLNLIPRYLPRFGMAPEWARASRPLVLVFMGIATVVTLSFRADVDAQGGAYATGVLVLITSASIAVLLSVWQKPALRVAFLLITGIFIYTTIVNMVERPEGLKISSLFIGGILAVSLLSRAVRAVELRITEISLDEESTRILAEDSDQVIRLIARGPEKGDAIELLDKADAQTRRFHNLDPDECLIFFEVIRGDASDFSETLCVQGRRVGRHSILSAKSPVIANSIAGMLVYLERSTGQTPHVYFRWTEASPVTNLFRFLFLGEGDTAPLTQEVLRRAIRDPKHRPVVHVS
ncbi:amino acid transporter [Terriglobus sp.]|uniref:amino acid transporter n=1 Tax=Terriglobus sp. TaxID=1889013 RepID=UPI003B00A64F